MRPRDTQGSEADWATVLGSTSLGLTFFLPPLCLRFYSHLLQSVHEAQTATRRFSRRGDPGRRSRLRGHVRVLPHGKAWLVHAGRPGRRAPTLASRTEPPELRRPQGSPRLDDTVPD